MSRFFKIPYRSSLLVALMGATLVVAGCKVTRLPLTLRTPHR